ncbi:MAG: SPFH domain-containing protein [Acidobacteria bacterium]|jgi:membrane protease subunit (stomatin/prohibitin family)|nr:SPFH domain-containing protein [Acidobacteriota bacterium]MCU0253976.1 SPFH domain-containing protein [Acidobacteriota bacterium]
MPLTLEVIEWRQDDGTEIVHRFEPGGEIKLGAQLTVTENQWAVFFKDGRAYDVFETGRHVLGTANIPLLVELLKLPYGGRTPFRADVYFVARKLFADQKWGTREPVVFRDPQFGMLRLRAHGRYAIHVVDPRQFVNVLVGTLGRYTTAELADYLREIVVARLNDALGELAIPLLDLPRQYDELAEELKRRIAPDVARLGLALGAFYVGAIVPPEEVAKVIDERSSMAAVGLEGDYLRFKAARALGDAAAGGAGAAGEAAAGGAAAGMGLGVGAGLGMALPGMLRDLAARGPAAPTAPACARCHAELPVAARFCPQCGAARGG